MARLCGARCWLHIQDFEVDAAFDLGLIRGKWIRKIISAIERWLMRRFDRVSTISIKMLERLQGKGIPGGVLFSNWVDTQAIRPLGRTSPYRSELGIADNVVVAMYSGNMGQKQGLEILAAVAREFAETDGAGGELTGPDGPSVLFVFCGGGAGRADLMRACAGLKNVRFLELQPAERLNEFLNLADIHLLPQREDAADLVMPSKLTGMMASGRPTLATAHGGTEIAKVLQKAGYVVEPGDVKAFCEKLTELACDEVLRAKMGTQAREYAERHLSRESVLSAFERELEACAAGN